MIRLCVLACGAACGRVDFAERGDATASPADAQGCGHTFCDDFDRLPPVESGWDEVDTSGGTFSLASGELVADVAFPISGRIFLRKRLPRATTSIHLELDLGLDVMTANAEVDLVQLIWTEPPAPCTAFGEFLVRDRSNTMIVQETYGGCSGGNVNDPFLLPSGQHHIAFDLALGALGAARVTLAVDGATLVDQPTAAAMPASPIDLQLGAPGEQALTGPWRIRYDNLIVDVN